MSIIYMVYPSNLDVDGRDVAIAFDEQEVILRNTISTGLVRNGIAITAIGMAIGRI